MKKRKICSIILATALAVTSLAGCGGTSGTTAESTGTETGNEDPVTLSILAGQSTTDAGIEDMITAAVAEKYPYITLEWECIDWGNDFPSKMATYMQSGLPDIMIGKGQDIATYAPLDVLADLTDLEGVSKVVPDALNGVSMDGKVYGLIYSALYQGVYYNKALFEEYKLEVPTTQEELQTVIDTFNDAGVTPFASHFVDSWSIGNILMQFAINDVFNKTPDWAVQFRDGKVSFADSEEYKACYSYVDLINKNTFKDTFSLEQTACDARMVSGEAAMKVSGAWSIQNFLDIDENFDFGIFPFPNQTGDAKLIYEPNITFMKSATTEYSDAVDKVLNLIASDEKLAVEIYDYTNTASMLQGVTPTFNNPSQTDIDKYVADGNIVDANTGNTQLVWGGFQDENANDVATWIMGNSTIEDALKAADSRKDNSKP